MQASEADFNAPFFHPGRSGGADPQARPIKTQVLNHGSSECAVICTEFLTQHEPGGSLLALNQRRTAPRDESSPLLHSSSLSHKSLSPEIPREGFISGIRCPRAGGEKAK